MRIFTFILLIAFGLLTFFLSSSVLFDWFGIRALEGNFVPFVVWINLLSAILYLIAAYLLIMKKKMAFTALIISLILLIIGNIVLQFYIKNGGLYELKTPKALLFRTIITVILTSLSYVILFRKKSI
ncbi:MAG: hypothetical protein IT220_01780 [Flavobacteriaceae bacterium]|nr:hypothetical protein [Flavobacteriaceae bacterium]